MTLRSFQILESRELYLLRLLGPICPLLFILNVQKKKKLLSSAQLP